MSYMWELQEIFIISTVGNLHMRRCTVAMAYIFPLHVIRQGHGSADYVVWVPTNIVKQMKTSKKFHITKTYAASFSQMIVKTL